MQRSGRLRLSEVNQHLVCALCGGYFIDATTIVECLHSFCRSCLIKYLETNSFCPICDVQIHKAKPFLNIKPDKALQDIVYKLVPGLFHSEMRRRQEFYAKHPERMHETTPEGRGVGVERLIYSPDDSISLSLEYLDGEEEDAGCASNHSSESENEGAANKRYLQCPALVTIGHLKKFLRIKYELASGYTVEVIHRRESLPDDYTLMDVAYIYTWKRNGPMRFFFRIIQSWAGNDAHLQQESAISGVTTSVKDSSPSSISETSTIIVSCSTPKPEINDDKEKSKVLPQAESQNPITDLDTPKPELRRDSSTEISMKSSSKEHPATVSTSQSAPVVISKCMQSIPVPATVTSVSSALITCSVASSSQSLQTKSQAAPSRTVTKISSHPTTIALTKTTTATKTTPSLLSSTVPNSDSNPNKITTQNIETVTKPPVQQTSTTNNGALSQKLMQVSTRKPSTEQSFPNAEQSVSKSATQELAQAASITTNQITSQPVSKEIVQKAKTQISLQSSASSNISQKTGQILNGLPKTEKEVPSPSNMSSSETNNCKVQSQQEKQTTVCKTGSEETTSSNNKNKVRNEDNKNTSIPSATSGSSVTTKAVLSKYVQQRLHSSVRKHSHPMKITSEASSTKGSPFAAKNQSQTTKDSNKIRTNMKLTDKPATGNDNLNARKENPQMKSITDEKIETISKVPVTTNSQKEMPNPDNALHTAVNNVTNSTSGSNNINNNINKVPQQNQQIIRNNQQILKKNDEIMRCVPIKRPIQPIPRKAPDTLKNSIQNRDDDKTNAKKRRTTITNPIKRPAINSSDSKEDQLQPVTKKSRPTTENNRKTLQSDQKTSQLKIRFPNLITGQNILYPAIKSESNVEITPNALKNNTSNNPNVSMHLGSSEFKGKEVKNQENIKNHVINERVQPNTTVQRPSSTNQISATSKVSIASTLPSTIKTEPHITKAEVAHPPVRGSSQNVTSPLVPIMAHVSTNSRLCPTPLPPGFKGKTGMEPDGTGALDLSASPRRQQHQSILSIAQTLARRQQQQQHCPSPAPPPLSPLSSLSPFPVIPGVPVRSPPPQLRIPVPPHHRSSHSQQQRPSSLSSSSPSPPADTIPSSSRMGPPQQQQAPPPQPPPPLTPDMYASHLMSPATLMFRQQLELQRLLGAGKHTSPPGMEWYNDANSIKRFEHLMKSLQQQGAGRNSPFYPFNNNNNTAAATNNHRK